MLIRALCDYYDTLVARGDMIPDGYSSQKIDFIVTLDPSGRITGIVDKRVDKKGKGCVMTGLFPKRQNSTKIDAYIVEHRSMYLFGLDYDAKSQKFSTAIAGKSGSAAQKPTLSWKAHRERATEFFADVDSPIASAFLNFVKTWEPEKETENPLLMEIGSGYSNAAFAFILSGFEGKMLHEDEAVKRKWEAYYELQQAPGEDAYRAQCAVTGKTAVIARIHDKIKGIPFGRGGGVSLVTFNNDAECSYGKKQAYNGSISDDAMHKYTAALNWLIGDNAHHFFLSEKQLTVVIFAMTKERENDYLACFNQQFPYQSNESDTMDDEETEKALTNLADARMGIFSIEGPLEKKLDPNVEFYIVGFGTDHLPTSNENNGSRLSVKFIYHQKVGRLFQNIAQHNADMKAFEQQKIIPMWRILKELNRPEDKQTSKRDGKQKGKQVPADPALTAKLFDAIICGYNYPNGLLARAVSRVLRDQDSNADQEGKTPEKSGRKKINPTRAAILRACINRNARLSGKEEEIKMALDTQNKNPAYLCGRLFAVLEHIQTCAAGGKLNRTIKDAYFSSASSNPAVILPKLIELAQYHLKSIGRDDSEKAKRLNGRISDILKEFDGEFPVYLNLTDQGKFILGYYHQYSNLQYFEKKTEEENND